MFKRTVLVLMLSVMMTFTLGCGFLGNLLGGGGGGNVATLWSDVPSLPGTAKADLEIPLAAKLAMQAMFQGKVDFIAYTTKQPVKSVVDFYSVDRMKASGWINESGGCQSATANDSANQGAMCFFSKKEGGKEYGLAIIVGMDEKTKDSQLFYGRIDMTATPTTK